jgi:2,4-dienoyl-CoA reductase-like NADH-dependent reductase (Old Yellow Enzyme family)
MTLDHLMRPLRLGPTEITCRVVSTSHQTTLVHNHIPTDDFVAYQEARAAGGVGLIIMEAVAIAPSGLLTAHTIGGYLPEIVEGYRRVAAAVKPHGTKLFVQLFHGGREVISSAPRPVVVSSSALPSHRYHTEPRALRTDEVKDVIAAYGRCAALAAEAGLDGIEITAAHGYLGEQFFDPTWNLRTDAYGEEPRFLTEVLDAVRAGSGGRLTLGLRLSADSPAARAVVRHFRPLVDYLHVAIGNSATFDGCVNIVPPLPAPRNVIAELTGPFQVGVPLIATTRVVDPADADRMIGAGVADAFGMNRALITDPDMPRKARAGHADTIIRCIGCNACIAHYHAETPIRCAQNPRTGRERTFPRPAATTPSEHVVVVGAGPAGLAATAEALGLGHRVTVFEREPHPGGQAWLAGQAPAGRELWASLSHNYEQALANDRVAVRYGTTADADRVTAAAPDRVVIATGARPFFSQHALRGVDVRQAWEVLGGAIPDGRVIVADWGRDSIGLDCAELLAEMGREVTLAIGSIYPGEALHQYHRNVYIGRLLRAGVRFEHYLGLESAADGLVRFRNVVAPELTAALPADALVLSLGRTPADELSAELRERGVDVREAGDCRSPRGLEEAILEGTLAVRADDLVIA